METEIKSVIVSPAAISGLALTSLVAPLPPASPQPTGLHAQETPPASSPTKPPRKAKMVTRSIPDQSSAPKAKSIDDEDEQPMTQADKDKLKRLEGIIEKNMKSVFDIGNALSDIQKDKLYRDEYPTFDAYCLAKWGFGRAYGYRHIQAAAVYNGIKGLLTTGDTNLPQSEAQVRPLMKLKNDPEKLALAWTAAVKKADGGQVTEVLTAEVVAEMTGVTQGKKGAVKTVTGAAPTGDSKPVPPVDTPATKPDAETPNEPKPALAFDKIAILELIDALRGCVAEGDSDGVLECADDIESIIKGKPPTKSAQQEEKNEREELDEEEHGDDRTDDEPEQEADGDHGDDHEGEFEREPGEVVMNRR